MLTTTLLLASIAAPVPEHLMKERWPVGTPVQVWYAKKEVREIRHVQREWNGKRYSLKQYRVADVNLGYSGWWISEADLIRTVNDPFATWLDAYQAGD